MLKERFGCMWYYFPRKYARKILFRDAHGYDMNWKKPQGIDEKMNWLLAYSYGRREAYFADKYKVREYVKKCGFEDMLTKLYGVYKHTNEININELPDKFILKTNHDCGSNIICKDKRAINWDKDLEKLEYALHLNYANKYCEYHYKYIKRRIVAEEFLDDGREERLTDYKIHCFYGKPYCIEVITGRKTNCKEYFMDLQWKQLDYAVEAKKGYNLIDRPKSLSAMLEAAEILGRPFPYARIDFYDIFGHPYFGEITLSPHNSGDMNEKGQRELGDMCKLPSRREIFYKNLFGYRIEV